MKNILFLFICLISFNACKDKNNPSPAKTDLELLSLNNWQFSRFTNTNGTALSNSEISTQAIFLSSMRFEFQSTGITVAYDKITKQIITKGTWTLDSKNLTVKLLDSQAPLSFKIVSLTVGKMTLNAPTGNYLSNSGTEINLELTSI